jgi:hypothetical protein
MVSCCSGRLAVRRAAAWSYVKHIGPRWQWTNISPEHVELILKINKHCYLSHLVGLDFITLPTLKMHGQTQIKNINCSLNWICVIKAFEIHWFSKLFYEMWNNNMLTAKRSDNANLGFSLINCNTARIHTEQSFAHMWVNTCNPSLHKTGNPWRDPLPLDRLLLYLAKHKTQSS